ncbi:MAG: hypothetical protein WB870_06845 [Gallionellaceae bacterium]
MTELTIANKAVADVLIKALNILHGRIEQLEAELKEEKSQIHKRIAGVIENRQAADRDLAARVAALENQPTMRYRGVWAPGELYEPGDVVTLAGSAWHCWEQTKVRPGDNTDWQLAVKRGSNGRDAR